MSLVRTLVGFRPPPRYLGAGSPWTHAQVDEGPGATGPWLQIDDQPLSPLDADPTHPAQRNFTVTTAQLTDGWYRIRFLDAAGNSATTPATYANGGSLPPSLSDLRLRSPLLRQKYPDNPYEPDVEEEFAAVRDTSVALVQSWTARILDPLSPAGCASAYAETCEAVPGALVPVAVRAVALTAEQVGVAAEAKLARQGASRLRLRGFSAGPYSESYWDPAMVRGGAQGRPQFVDNPDLNDALWALATEEARQTLIAEQTGVQLPAGVASTTDFNRQAGVGQSGLFGAGGPDGW